MNAPEKLYFFNNEPILKERSVKRQDANIEYVRTDAFIAKVERFLEYNLNDRVEIQVPGTLIPSLTSKKAFIEDFKKAIKL